MKTLLVLVCSISSWFWHPTDGQITPGCFIEGPIWCEEFDPNLWEPYGRKWQAGHTNAYEFGNRNPHYNKLDWVEPNNVVVENGLATFRATLSTNKPPLETGETAWDVGLISTEDTTEKFTLYVDNYMEILMQLPTEQSAWPCLWTWKHNNTNYHYEVDTLEYHANRPNLLELTSHILPADADSCYCWYKNSAWVQPGLWITVGTHYGQENVSWYINRKRVYTDQQGVGPTWSGNVILSMSVSKDPAPTPGVTSSSFKVDYVRVYKSKPSYLDESSQECRDVPYTHTC